MNAVYIHHSHTQSLSSRLAEKEKEISEFESQIENGAVQRPASPSQIRRPQTLRHQAQTRPHFLQVRRHRRRRRRRRRRHSIHRPQCRRPLRGFRLRLFHRPKLLRGIS